MFLNSWDFVSDEKTELEIYSSVLIPTEIP